MSKPFRLIASTGIHKGDRDYQQDQVAVLAHPRFNGCVLGVVADGMGGRSGGRKASDQVMMTARQLFERYSPETDDATSMLKNLVNEAHIVIRLTAISAEQEPHSTIAAFLINPRGDCHWVHAGDSRVYHFQHGRLLHRTLDHSYVQALVDRGEITEAEANVHPHSNILVGCLGAESDPPATTHLIPQLQPGDMLLAVTASGYTANIIAALEAARRGALLAVCLCSPQGDLARHCDTAIEAPQAEPALINELHLAAGHMFCRLTDYYLFENAVALTPYLQGRHTTEV